MTTPNHLSKSYDDELARLKGEITRMGELALAQLEAAMDAITRQDMQAANAVVDGDDAIDAIEHAINHDVVRLLALRAPMARDLREVFAALRVASDIERIGDHAANIAKRATLLAPSTFHSTGLHELARQAAVATSDVLTAWHHQDAEAARKVWANDDTLDNAYTRLFQALLGHMLENPASIANGTQLLFIAKHLERIGDYATNIAENVWYAATGEPLKPAMNRDP